MTVKIIIIKDKPIGQIVVTKGVTTIGRKSDCDISIKDPAVSGVHAQIEKVGENYLIQDMGSTNGLLIGGKKVTQHVLKNNDMVVIGEHILKFLISTPKVEVKATAAAKAKKALALAQAEKEQKEQIAAARQAELQSGEVVRDETVVRTPVDPLIQKAEIVSSSSVSAQASGGEAKGHLAILSGENSGTIILLEGGLTTIGEPGVQIAAVQRRAQGHYIVHVDGGKNKDKVPLVNGEPTGLKSRKLEPGDKIEVAGIQMEYC